MGNCGKKCKKSLVNRWPSQQYIQGKKKCLFIKGVNKDIYRYNKLNKIQKITPPSFSALNKYPLLMLHKYENIVRFTGETPRDKLHFQWKTKKKDISLKSWVHTGHAIVFFLWTQHLPKVVLLLVDLTLFVVNDMPLLFINGNYIKYVAIQINNEKVLPVTYVQVLKTLNTVFIIISSRYWLKAKR